MMDWLKFVKRSSTNGGASVKSSDFGKIIDFPKELSGKTVKRPAVSPEQISIDEIISDIRAANSLDEAVFVKMMASLSSAGISTVLRSVGDEQKSQYWRLFRHHYCGNSK